MHPSMEGGREGGISLVRAIRILSFSVCMHAGMRWIWGKLLWYERKVAKQQRRLTEQRNASEGGAEEFEDKVNA